MAEQHGGLSAIATIPASVETALRRTMVLGLATEDVDKPTFYFERAVSWHDHDSANKPWDWTAAPILDITPPPVQPICAIEFFAPLGRTGAQYTEVGDFFPSTLIVTFTTTDYADAKDTSYLTVGPEGTRYWFRYWKPVLGLGGLNVYQAHFEAQDTA